MADVYKVQKADDEQTIRDLECQWGKTASAKDLEGVVAFYAPEASLVWPDAPAIHGTSAIRKAWTALFAPAKSLNLRFTPERIDIADAGDIAVDFGVVEDSEDDGTGPVYQTFKYLVVWQKLGGTWKVFYDSYNSIHTAPKP